MATHEKHRVWVFFHPSWKADDNSHERWDAWLDDSHAVECCGGALFDMEPAPDENQTALDAIESVAASIRMFVKPNADDRCYVIISTPTGDTAARFVSGGRKPPPWRGAAENFPVETID